MTDIGWHLSPMSGKDWKIRVWVYVEGYEAPAKNYVWVDYGIAIRRGNGMSKGQG